MNQITVKSKFLSGKIKVPTSKSYAHRALICAALSKEKVLIKNVSISEDIKATISCLEKIGVIFSINKNSNDNFDVLVNGEDIFKVGNKNVEIFCNESGSTLRFLLPIMSILNKKVIISGKNSLMNRPMKIYQDIYKNQNLFYNFENNKIYINGILKSGNYEIPGNISSQFLTGLFFILPILEYDSKVIITGDFQSKSYLEMTIDVMNSFGISILKLNDNEYLIKGNQKYTAKNIKNEYEVEGDFSQAAFWLVAGVINGDLEVVGLNKKSIQGDKIIVDIIKSFNGNIEEIEGGYKVKKSLLNSSDINVKECPDLVPIISLLMSKSLGRSKIYGAERVRLKESDRLAAITEGLNKLGCCIEENYDNLQIDGDVELIGNIVNSFNDHRIEMTLVIASSITNSDIIIKNPYSVKKSYPNFYKDFKNVGGIIY